MNDVTGAELAIAFNQHSDKKGWSARSSSRTSTGLDLVHFSGPNTIITLTYDVMDGKFIVRFNKAHAAFGDYIKSIAKALYYVLTVLKAAGMPFDAPLTPAGVRVLCEATDDSTVYAEWPGMHPAPIDAGTLHPVLPFAMNPEYATNPEYIAAVMGEIDATRYRKD